MSRRNSTRRASRARFTSSFGKFANTKRDNTTGKPLTAAYVAGQSSYRR
jgi:hypothetical protein